MHPGSLRKPFNPDGPFVARHRVLVQGSWLNIGDRVPKGAVPARRMKQLYESMKVDVGTEEEVRKVEVKKMIPSDWRTFTNRYLFPLVQELTGKRPKNRVEAFDLMGGLDGSA